MPVPTNISAATALAITSLPTTVTQDVSGLSSPYEVWFKYTGAVNRVAIGVFGTTATATALYQPRVTVYLSDGVTQHLGMQLISKPMVVPVDPGSTYYFKVDKVGVGVPDQDLVISFIDEPRLSSTNPVLGIPDDTPGHPMALVDSVTGQVLRYVNFPAGEFGVSILTSGVMGVEAILTPSPNEFRIYSPSYGLIASRVTGVPSTEVASDQANTFYYNDAPDGSPASIKSINAQGVDGPSWALPSDSIDLWGIAVSRDGRTLYYAQAGSNKPVHRYDLAGSSALSDLVAGVVGEDIKEIVVLADDTVLVAADVGDKVRRYSTAGALLNTYSFSDLNRITLATDDPATFWAWERAGGVETLKNVRVSDGSVLATLSVHEFEFGMYVGSFQTVADNPDRFGASGSCPFFIASLPGLKFSQPIPSYLPPSAKVPCPPQAQINNGGKGAAGCNPGGKGWVSCYAGALGTVPQHADPTPGLGIDELWVDLVHEDYPSLVKTTYRRALAEIADDPSFYGGRKPAGLLAVGDVEHGLSNEQNTFEAATVDLEFSDANDLFIRDLLYTQDLEGDEVRIYLSDKARRDAALAPRVLMRATVQRPQTQSRMRATLQACDALFSDFGPFGADRQFPEVKIPDGVWLDTPPDSLALYMPILYGEKSDRGAIDPITNQPSEKGLVPLIYVGQQQIGGNIPVTGPANRLPYNPSVGVPWGAQQGDLVGFGTMSGRVWSLVTSVYNGEEGPVSNLAGTIDNNRAISVNWSRPQGNPPVDYYRVYFFLSDANGFASFDPQVNWAATLEARFVTHDNVTIDGNGGSDFSVTIPDFTVGTAYSGGSAGTTTTSVPALWDAYVVALGALHHICDLYGSDLGNGVPTAQHDRVLIDLATRAGSEFLVPGYAGWPFADTFVDYTLPDGSVMRATMIFARGPVSDDHKAGTVNMAVNAVGYEDVGDGTGNPILEAHLAQQHWLENFVLNGQYKSGAWVTTSTNPRWEDGTAKVRSSSFLAAQAFSKQKVGGDGYRAGWYVSQEASMAGYLAQWNRETETRLGVNEEGQIFVWYLDDGATSTAWPRIDHQSDMFGDTARVPGQERENVVSGVGDWDPDADKFRSATFTYEDAGGIAKYKGKRKQGATLEFSILNVDSHIQNVLKRRLVRLRFGEAWRDITVRISTATSGSPSLLDIPVGTGVKLNTVEGIGPSGDVDRRYIVMRKRLSLRSRLLTLSLLDVEDLLVTRALIGSAAGNTAFLIGSAAADTAILIGA